MSFMDILLNSYRLLVKKSESNVLFMQQSSII